MVSNWPQDSKGARKRSDIKVYKILHINCQLIPQAGAVWISGMNDLYKMMRGGHFPTGYPWWEAWTEFVTVILADLRPPRHVRYRGSKSCLLMVRGVFMPKVQKSKTPTKNVYTPRTQMTRVLIGKGLFFWWGVTFKNRDHWGSRHISYFDAV